MSKTKSEVIEEIRNKIYDNNDQTITGDILQEVLVDMVDIVPDEGPFVSGEGEGSAVLSGSGAQATGRFAAAEGEETIVRNRGEHAEGQFNISHSSSTDYGNAGNTQHSIGIGTASDARKNAFEVMQNGNAYLIGVGGYDGTNPSSSTPINQLIGQGGNSPLFVVGTLSHHDEEFVPNDGQPSFSDALSAFLSGRTVLLIDSNTEYHTQVVLSSNPNGDALYSSAWAWEYSE